MAPTVTYATVAKGIKPPPKPTTIKKVANKPVLVAVPRLEDIARAIQFGRKAAALEVQVQKAPKTSNSPAPSTTFDQQQNFKETSLAQQNAILEGSPAVVDRSPTNCVTASPGTSKSQLSDQDQQDGAGSSETTASDESVGQNWVARENEIFVNTVEQLHAFLPKLLDLKKHTAQLFCDLEGKDLGKPPGTISLLQMTVFGHTWIFDVTVLQGKVFNTMGSRGQSIRGVFEAKDIIKVWWDVRNDANALFFHYQVRLNGIDDLQFLELATRTGRSRERRAGLGDCVGVEGVACGKMTQEEACAWTSIKQAGKRYFRSNALGYGVFDVRPLPY